MASISREANGRRTIQFVAPDGKRRSIRLGKVSQRTAESFRERVEQLQVRRVLDACPNAEWRLIVALSRFGGLRVPSEVASLRWRDVDWAGNTIKVTSPKTARVGKESRTIPLFPELRPFLEEAFDAAPEGAEYAITVLGNAVENPQGWYGCNPRTQMENWRKCMGIEPTGRARHARPDGFEDRGHHQVCRHFRAKATCRETPRSSLHL